MARINHNNSLDTIDKLMTDAKNRGVMHLRTDTDEMPGRKLLIASKSVLNFVTCGYLGLELDQRLKDGAMEYIQKYGTQFSVSRAYVSLGVNFLLEDYLSQMYDGSPVIVYSSTSIAHISVMPTLVNYDDAIVLDQQVHMCVQTAAQLLRQKGVPIEMIRHSNMEMLERVIEPLCRKHRKVWYMIDGVYSMFGDLAPMDDLIVLLDKYKELNLYIDDAHGMGWYGKNGTGYAFSKAPKHPKIILVNTLAKGFGVSGGLAVFPDHETFRKVQVFGGPLSYSHPLSPSIIGSSIASANVHLSDELTQIQTELGEAINYCNQLLADTELTVVSNPITPIYFIGMGLPKLGYNMVKRLLDDGFLVSPATFPAVPTKNTGLRFTITRHVTEEDIKALVEAMVYHYPLALEEEGRTVSDVQKAFKVKPQKGNVNGSETPMVNMIDELIIEEVRTIKDVDKAIWNRLLASNGSFSWDGMLSLEDVFHGNSKPEENWEFYYFIVYDNEKQPILATFFTATIYKEDMLALESVSLQVEEKRKTDPYYLTSKTLTMGSFLTEGEHCYSNREHPQWREAFSRLFERVSSIQDSIKANSILLRDFDSGDEELRSLFAAEGFVPIDMPNSNVVNNMVWNTKEELLQTVSSRNRRHLRTEVFKLEHCFEVEFRKTITDEESDHLYQLYLNVETVNRGFNMFPYPKRILKVLSKHDSWEFTMVYLKPEFDSRAERKPVAAVWAFVQPGHYSPMILGMDYSFSKEFKIYKQTLYQVVKRARSLGIEKVYLGLSADIEKKKFGAVAQRKTAYVQAQDHYNLDTLETMSAS